MYSNVRPFFKFHIKKGINSKFVACEEGEAAGAAFGDDQMYNTILSPTMRRVTSDICSLIYSLTMAKTSLSPTLVLILE